MREPFDHAARSGQLVHTLISALPVGEPLRVVELGAGLGSGMRYLAPLLPGSQHWTLVDHDADLLAAVGPSPTGVQVDTLQRDLRDPQTLGQLDLALDLVSTQALLDLVSKQWLVSLSAWLVARRLPLLAALTVDGRVGWQPEDSRDAEVQAAFRAHQLTDRGFGPSPGPRAAMVLAGLLSRAGYTVTLARSDWEIGAGFTGMLEQMVTGTASAAAEAAAGIASDGTVAGWREDRMAATASGKLSLRVGHLDLLAIPQN
jgi:trans-aconitate methyltransferase